MSTSPSTRSRVVRRAALAVCLAAVTAISACSSSSSPGSGGTSGSAPVTTAGGTTGTGGGPTGGSFTVGITAENLGSLLPGMTGDNNLAYAVWTPLTVIEPGTSKVVDAMAQSITTNDQQHWTIKIKSGWTFQNGEPVTAQSFADSWNVSAYGPNAIFANYLFGIFQGYADLNPASGKPKTDKMSGVQVVDAHTLKVTLTQPLSQFPYILSGTTFAPIPKAATKNLDAFGKLPIGNGPYQVAAPGLTAGAQQVTLKRYASYAGTDKGHADTIVVKAFQSSSTAYTAFQSGAIDATMLDSGSDLASAKSQYPDQLVDITFPAVNYLGFPLWDPRFKDPRVREAFSLAIDRDAIIKALLHGFGVPANGLAPDSVAGGGQADCPNCNYDPAKAKQLLQQAGGWSGSLTLYTKQDPTLFAVLQAIANELRNNLGISSISLKQQPIDQIYPNITSHKVDGPFLLYMGAAYPSVYNLVDALFSKGSGTNTTGFESTAVAAQMTKAAQASSPDQAIGFAQQAAKTALTDLPLAPVYFPAGALIHSTKLSNIVDEYLGDVHLATVTVG
jgi:oligopeptide transport system substrate-binding protein